MKKTFHYLALILVVGSLSLFACNNNNNDDDDVTTGDITYTNHVKAIITSNCAGCHAGAGASAGLDLTTYANVKAACESGELLTRINDASNPMPQAGLMAQSKRDQIQSWVDGGYIE